MITHEDVDRMERIYAREHRLNQIVIAAVEWFDEHRPQWGPGTLPAWYVDAREDLRKEAEEK